MFGNERQFEPGDLVVYCKTKHSPRPGPRAKQIDPEPRGEDYTYRVDKYWVVMDLRDTGDVVVQTRRGKRHLLPADDPNLRHATLSERWLKARRFPAFDPALPASAAP